MILKKKVQDTKQIKLDPLDQDHLKSDQVQSTNRATLFKQQPPQVALLLTYQPQI